MNSIEKYENNAWIMIDLKLPFLYNDIGVVLSSNGILLVGGQVDNHSMAKKLIFLKFSGNSITKRKDLSEANCFAQNNFYINDVEITTLGRDGKKLKIKQKNFYNSGIIL